MTLDRLRRWAELLTQSLAALSVVALVAELELGQPDRRPDLLVLLDCFFAAAFTAEYAARWWRAPRRLTYLLTPFALIDLAALVPFYLEPFTAFRALQIVRLARVLRVLKLYRSTEAVQAVWGSFLRIKHEMSVVGFVLISVVLV